MKKDNRHRTEAQKQQTRRRAQHENQKLKTAQRTGVWRKSELATRQAGYPIDAHITVLSDAENIEQVAASLWRRLRRLMTRRGFPFYVFRGPEYAPRRGLHLHLALHLPETLYGDVAAILVETTGAEMSPWFDVAGARLGRLHGVVTKSADTTWMLQRYVASAGGSHWQLVEYAAKGSGKEKAIGRHQRSGALIELTRAAG